MEIKNAWEKYNDDNFKVVMDFAEGYKKFITDAKTERECVTEAVAICEANGYVNLDTYIAEGKEIKTGDKVYVTNMKKNLLAFKIGSVPFEKGINILGAHIDSPRIDLKQNPLYEDTELALLDTHYYGGIKKYQWVTLPLALHGVVVKKDGSSVNFVVGEDANDPVLVISDLLPHLSAGQMKKSASEIIDGEDLNVLIGSIPLKGEEKEKVKGYMKKILKDKYNFEEDDFISAEIEVVPAGAARDLGLDASMVIGYGHDDRVCAYSSLLALLEAGDLERTGCCFLVDKEEVGSQGATGAHSAFFENTIAEIMALMGVDSNLKVRRALANSKMLSSDVSAAFDPNYASVNERKNTAYFSKGLALNKYTGSRGKGGCNDANAEFVGQVRAIMDNNGVTWQTAELGRVDAGGGGTIACISANYGMEVIDSGVPVLNMHAPWEVISKVDLYEAKQGYLAFLKDAK
ncbi:MAG: aminopeptidase [Erysipelotrichales bacterium]|nr:aminopeptidase [Erysipelotrichales bacterium]